MVGVWALALAKHDLEGGLGLLMSAMATIIQKTPEGKVLAAARAVPGQSPLQRPMELTEGYTKGTLGVPNAQD